MANKRDYYDVMQLQKGASDKDIKAAYGKMARKFHPDVNPGDANAEARFKEISEAYQVLSDPQKRAMYDRFGHQAFGRGTAGGQQGHWDFSNFDFSQFGKHVNVDDFGNLFGLIFGGQQRAANSRQPVDGSDLQYTIDLSFQDVLNGLNTRLLIQHDAVCEHCKGKGAEPGHDLETCPNCQGSGQVKMSSGFINLGIPQTCPQCHGAGKLNSNPCRQCHGHGTQQQTERIAVKIPAGAENGSKVRVAGKGHAGRNGGKTGDLYIITRVQNHPIFERRGDNLYCDVPITMPEAALGARINVPTPFGDASMTIPPGTQSGQTFRLRGKGVPHLKGVGRGDQFVTVKVITPQNPDTRTMELFREIARLNPNDPREDAFATSQPA